MQRGTATLKRRPKVAWLVLALAALLLGVAAVGLGILLPSWLRSTIERVGSESTGRPLRIAGTFDVTFSLRPTLVAEEITVGNASWANEPEMVRIARVAGSIDLASLWNPPFRIRHLTIEGVRVHLERDPEGRGNWEIGPAPPLVPAPARASRSPVVFDRASIRDLELTYRGRPDAPVVRFGVERFDAAHEPETGMIAVDGAGAFQATPWEIAGSLGTLDRLWTLRDVEQSVTGRIGESRLSFRGRIRDPLALRGPDAEIDLEGPDLGRALAIVGLGSPVEGPFRLGARLGPSDEEVALDGNAEAGGVRAEVRGRVRDLLDWNSFEATIEASGPDASRVGAWTGIEGFPPRPFAVRGRVRRVGEGFRLDEVTVRLDATHVAVSGTVGEPPRCIGTDLAFAASGPDLSTLSKLARVRLPPGAYSARGRFRRGDDGLVVEGVEIDLEDTVVRGGGTIGEPPRLETLDLSVEGSGADLSVFSGLATIGLPAEPFEFRGRLARRGEAFELDDVDLRVSEDAAALRGRIVPARRLEGSEFEARVEGPDLARAASRFGTVALPSEPYRVSGRIRVIPEGYELEGVDAQAGRIATTLSGRLGSHPLEDGTALDVRAQGPALSDLAAWGAPTRLPDEPFAVSGVLRTEDRVLRVEGAVAALGEMRAEIDGALSPLDLSVTGSGPSLRGIGPFFPETASGWEERLPDDPFTLAARLHRIPEGLEIRDARARIGTTEIGLDGTIRSEAGLAGTDLRFEARAPDATAFSALAGRPFPAGAVAVEGRVIREEAATFLDALEITLGEARGRASGALGDLPELEGTALDVAFEGPDLSATVGPLTGLSPLPSAPFAFSARLEGNAARFVAPRFEARLGANDLSGTVAVTIEGRPFVEADLRSSHLGSSARPADEPEVEPAAADAFVLSERPLRLEGLRAVDGRVRFAASDVSLTGVPLRDVIVEGTLADGTLRVDRIEGTGKNGGRATASLTVAPADTGYLVRLRGMLAGGRVDLSKTGEDPAEAPALDLEFEIEGTGPSLHAIAASADGGAWITLGPGRIPNNLSDFVTSGFVRGLLDVLNPFRKSAPYTEVECGVFAAEVEDGRAVVGPIAARTDALTVVGNGKVDFTSEAIDLEWTLKPRKGVGISAGSIANPYIKLGGTLAKPSIEAKPIQAAASTGAAVATGGLTLLFRGLYDRITAERKVCDRALEEVRKRSDARDSRGTEEER